jgi:phage/plasmid-associated DNA primase
MPDDKRTAFLEKFDKDKLKRALPEYIGYAIKLAKQAMAKKQLSLLPSTKARIADWLKSDDYISQFIDECLVEITGTNGATVKYVYDQFRPFMIEQGFGDMDIISFTQFRNALLSKGIAITRYSSKGIEEDRECVNDFDSNKKNRLKGYGINKFS